VKQNPLPPQTGWGRFPCRKKKRKIPQPLKKKAKKRRKKEKGISEELLPKTDSPKTRWGHLPSRKNKGRKIKMT
jgi:hypothetical protein